MPLHLLKLISIKSLYAHQLLETLTSSIYLNSNYTSRLLSRLNFCTTQAIKHLSTCLGFKHKDKPLAIRKMSDRRSYYTSKPIIHSRDPSNDSHTSYSSRSSTEGHYSSSRSSMANAGYYSGEPSYAARESREHKYRTPDDGSYHTITYPRNSPTNNSADRKYVSGTTSRSGKVEVIDQRRVVYDRDAPRIADASSEHYKKTQDRKHKSSRSHRS